MMNNEMLFGMALGINEPIEVKEIKFLEEEGELHIYLDFKKGSKFNCIICGTESPVYDTEEKTWRHLNFFQYKSYIHFRTPRTDCPEHTIHLIDVPWAKHSGFTLLFEAIVIQFAKHMPVKVIAEMFGEHDTRIWRIINRYVSNTYASEDYSDVTHIGVDETSSKKGHNYVSIFVDMDKSRVIYATEGKDSETIKKFKEELPYHGVDTSNITDFCSDMSPAFIKGITENFEDANLTFDKFHVVKLVNEAVDETRREEQKQHEELKNSRYLWLKNFKNLKTKQQEKLGTLLKSNLKTAKAYAIKLSLQDIYNDTTIDKVEAEKRLKKWLNWAYRCRITHIVKLAKSIKKHWNGIINYFGSNLTNGVLEGTNSLVQAAKARARGYRNINNLISMVYLIAGKLSFKFAK